jgi:pyridoxal phosphate enzyme (YggS family)
LRAKIIFPIVAKSKPVVKWELLSVERSQEIEVNLERVEAEISVALSEVGRKRSEVTMIAVTKNFPVSDIEILYNLGIRDFGENRDQEAREKVRYFREESPTKGAGIRWHFQGQLQRNKLASIGSWAEMVHSVDDVKYLSGLSSAAMKSNRQVRCLIQISLDEILTPARGGTDMRGALEILASAQRREGELSGISLVGVMGVAPITGSAKSAFTRLYQAFLAIQGEFPQITVLSAGMSSDFADALTSGATHIRLGSSILGSRR